MKIAAKPAHQRMTSAVSAAPVSAKPALAAEEHEMKITKRQLRRIVKEEKRNLLTEAAYIHDIFRQAGAALEMRDGSKLENLAREVEGLLMNEREQASFSLALNAMAEAAYELESYEEAEGY